MNPTLLRWLMLLVGCLSILGCPSTDWSENYDRRGKGPFDLLALHELLAARPEGLLTLRDTAALRALDTLSGYNYLFIGEYPYYTERQETLLLDFVARGGNAFIGAKSLPDGLATQLFSEDCYDGATDEYGGEEALYPTIYLDSMNAYRYPGGDSFHLVNVRYWQVSATPLSFFAESLLCDEAVDYQVLGGIDTVGINFLRVGYGEGDFYLHSNPVFFTNWFVLDSQQYHYPEAMLEAIGEGPVAWDEASRRYRRSSTGGGAVERDYEGGRNLLNGNETLRYIQQNRELAFAWYGVLVGVLFFIIFRGKRRQRVIPLLPGRENSSRRFIDTISRLVYQKGNHTALAQRELTSLRFHLNQRFGLRWTEGTPPPADLQQRLGLAEDTVSRALSQIRLVEAGRSMTEGDLLRFYRSVEPLYRA